MQGRNIDYQRYPEVTALTDAQRDIRTSEPGATSSIRTRRLDQIRDAIRTVQELLGNASVETTMIYSHVMNKGGRGGRCPLDAPRDRLEQPLSANSV